MQTAVEFLVKELKKTEVGRNLLEQSYNKDIIEQAKQEEHKLQHSKYLDGYNEGLEIGSWHSPD